MRRPDEKPWSPAGQGSSGASHRPSDTTSAAAAQRIDVIDWRPYESNTLQGFATVRFGSLIINDVVVHAKAGKRWVGLPAKPMLDTAKRPILDDTGRPKYSRVLEWVTREAGDRFRDAVLAALDRYIAGKGGRS